MSKSETFHHSARRIVMCGAIVLTLCIFMSPASAQLTSVAAEHTWLPWPSVWPAAHPLTPVVERVLETDWAAQPAWKVPMLVNGLNKQPLQCQITAYCSQCCDGGGRYTRWGSHVRRGICAADPRYWGPGSVVWIGEPVNEVCIVEDTGSAIKGPHRFDVCMEGAHDMCYEIGRRKTTYVPLHRVPPTSRWSDKPKTWSPPVWKLGQ